MVGGVQVLPIPAAGLTVNKAFPKFFFFYIFIFKMQMHLRRESDVSHNACFASLLGHIHGLAGSGQDGLQTGVGKLSVLGSLLSSSVRRVTDDHSEALNVVSF